MLFAVGAPSVTTTTTVRTTTTIPPSTTSTTLPGAACPATVIPAQGGTFTGTTTGTSAQNAACVTTGPAPERIFRWTPAVSGTATIQTCNATSTTYDTVVYVRSGTCTGPQISCNDDTTGCGTSTDPSNPHRGSRVRPTVVAGQTYYIVVDGYGGAQGTFSLTVTPPAPVGCAATVIPPQGGTLTGTTSGASALNTSCVDTGDAPERVFAWTPAVSGTATIQTCNVLGTTFDTVLYLRTGSCTGFQVACNDDTVGCGTSTDLLNPHRGSRLRPTVTAGTTYYLVVDGYSGKRGNFSLTVSPPGAPVPVLNPPATSDSPEPKGSGEGDRITCGTTDVCRKPVWDAAAGCRLEPVADGAVCDASDPCLPRVCSAGSCNLTSSPDARLLAVQRLRLRSVGSDLRVRGRAALDDEPAIDLASPVSLELQLPDGTPLRRVEVPVDALRTNRRGTSARYVRRRGVDVPSAEGLERLTLRLRRGRVAVSLKMTMSRPDGVDLGGQLRWVLHIGDACARDVAISCSGTDVTRDCASPAVAGGS
jgi:hypothetical protein